MKGDTMKSSPIVRPGVSVQEPNSSAPVMIGAPTSVAAFIGRAPTGPADKAVKARSFDEFIGTFGGAHPESKLADSVRLFFANGGVECWVVRLDKDEPTSSDYIGDKKAQTGLYALDTVDFNILVIPSDAGADLSGVWAPASHYCAGRGAFLIIDPPAGWTRAGRAEAAHNPYLVDDLRRGVAQDRSAVFYPRLRIAEGDGAKTIGPSGAIAGLMARTDAERGVWASMAGFQAELRSVAGPEVELNDREIGDLTAYGVNPLLRKNGKCVNWGNRTFHSLFEPTSGSRYIPVTRTKLFLGSTVRRGIAWTAFELNDETLWAKLRTQVTEFMLRLWRHNAFVGDTPSESLYVRCGRETIAADDQAQGRVNVEVGFAPLRPAEFEVIRAQGQAVPVLPPAPAIGRPTLSVPLRPSDGRTTSRSTLRSP